MDKILAQLGLIANDLDQKGLTSLADSVDGVMKVASSVKTAQYVGVQGYWIRNSRCWGNCYRQKRSSNPTMPTQEVWTECHSEYVKSITDKDARKSWDKYAGGNLGLLKDASARSAADSHLFDMIDSQIGAGKDIPLAVFSAVSAVKQEDFSRLIQASSDLLRIADAVAESDFAMSLKISEAAHELSKEAQWYNPVDWAAKGVRGLGNAQRGIGDWAQNRGEQSAARDLQRAQERNQSMQNRRQTRPWMQQNPAGGPQPAQGAPSPMASPGGAGVTPQSAAGAATGAGTPSPVPNPTAPAAPGAGPAATGAPGAAPSAPQPPQANPAAAVSAFTKALSDLHNAAGKDEQMFRQWVGMALKQSGINLAKKPPAAAQPKAPVNSGMYSGNAAEIAPGISGPINPLNQSGMGPKHKMNGSGQWTSPTGMAGPGF